MASYLPIRPSSGSIARLLVGLDVYLVYMIFCGFNGNRWLVSSLLHRGFRLVDEEWPPRRRS